MIDPEWIIGGLLSALGVLWAVVYKAMAKTEQQLDRCRDEHSTTRKTLEANQSTIIDMNGRIGRLEGQKEATEKMADRVIREVRAGVNTRQFQRKTDFKRREDDQ